MTIDKMKSLKAYQQSLSERLSSTNVPAKHVNREESYRRFLTEELKAVTKTLDQEALSGVKK